jgi:carbamoyl-phosphate synthase large subunit
MKKILVSGAGGAPAEGVINSLLQAETTDEIIGMGSDPFDLVLSNSKKKYLVHYANSSEYKKELMKILSIERPELVFFVNDLETYEISKYRNDIHQAGTKTYMPADDVIDTCVNKHKSYLKWREAGIKVPENILLRDEADLKKAFDKLADNEGKIWLRASSIGGGGKGALPTNDYEFAKRWVNRYNGWNDFVAAELLTPESVTWLSIWYHGELVVAQTRIRKGWAHSSRTVSGITGVTKVGQTFSDETVTNVALDAIRAVDPEPHGIYGVDMGYDKNGFPNPTEINISRFFTTILFFTQAGLNMPEIVRNIALKNEFPSLEKKINPLPDGLFWMRGMDTLPRLMTQKEIDQTLITI